MPITLNIFDHPSRKWRNNRPWDSAEDFFKISCPAEHRKSKRVIRSSIPPELLSPQDETPLAPAVAPSSNGWVRAAFHAYSDHHHLTFRAEDIWFAILSQLSFYINAHAEELRSHFVAHEGQKQLEVKDIGTIDTVDFGRLSREMADLIGKNVKDPELRDWIMPDWTTTTDNDRTVAAILMMGSLQKYFSYLMTLMCGIPSVTLLGEKSDWENMLARLDKLKELGDEPSQFATLLRPILQRFVACFDTEPGTKASAELIDFWSKIAHQTGGSGPYYLSGWITAFCFWDDEGMCMYQAPEQPVSLASFEGGRAGCELDGVFYHRVNTKDIPSGFASVPVTVDDNGKMHQTRMAAGSLGIELSSSGKMMGKGRYVHRRKGEAQEAELEELEEPGLDSVKPLAGWLMYEVKEPEEMKEMEKESEVGWN